MLELQRNVIFGQFIDTGSPIHRMDARIKLVITFVFIVASFLINDFLGFAIVLPLLVLIQLVSRVPIGYVLRGSQLFLGFLVFVLFFQVLFYPGDVPESSYLWRWGFLSISTEGLYTAGILGLRVIFLYYVTTLLMLTTSLVDLTNGLELIFGPLQRLRVPVNELVLVFVIAIKFVPIFIEEVERLARAQTARGVPFDEGGAHRHEHPELPWRPRPHQATPAARHIYRQAGAATGGGMDAGGLATPGQARSVSRPPDVA
ncbi:MAG: energy-coupling factor transporter transmembrane protein EcfT [Actinobacteria bacterium]|nr:energy-coupling factor transporter transmembrane protein EcfT [Actinomycetota bacterium]